MTEDTPQQKAVLARSRVAQKVRRNFPADTRVVATDGPSTDPSKKRIGKVEGTVLRHIPMMNAQGGTVVVQWDNGQVGQHSAGQLMTVLTRDVTLREMRALRVLPGETAPEYIRRMHLRQTELGGDKYERRPRKPGDCNCPHAYSLCKYAKYWREQTNPNHRTEELHGGWGWSNYPWHLIEGGTDD